MGVDFDDGMRAYLDWPHAHASRYIGSMVADVQPHAAEGRPLPLPRQP